MRAVPVVAATAALCLVAACGSEAPGPQAQNDDGRGPITFVSTNSTRRRDPDPVDGLERRPSRGEGHAVVAAREPPTPGGAARSRTRRPNPMGDLGRGPWLQPWGIALLSNL